MGTAGEGFNGFEDAFLKLLKRTLELAGEEFLEARDAEHLFVGIHGFGDAVAEEHQGVARLELQANGGVLSFGNEADGIGAFGEGFFGDAAANEDGRGMAGVDEFQMAFLIENAEEHGGVAADFRVIAEEAIDMIEDARGIGAESHAGERALKHGGEKRGAESLAGYVSDEKSGAAIAKRE